MGSRDARIAGRESDKIMHIALMLSRAQRAQNANGNALLVQQLQQKKKDGAKQEFQDASSEESSRRPSDDSTKADSNDGAATVSEATKAEAARIYAAVKKSVEEK